MTPLKIQIQNLNNHYKQLSSEIHKNDDRYKELQNYDLLFRHFYRQVDDKMTNINPSDRLSRSKRGLIDGLGSAIKFVTGNMDSRDELRINKIINHLEKNVDEIESQIVNEYSVNNAIIKQFNATLQNVQHNEILLKEKILNLSAETKNTIKETNTLHFKDVLNQFVLIYTTILNILVDIENSLTFCGLGAMHPSIIKTDDLLAELLRLVPFYKDQMPFPVTMDNVLKYQSLIAVHCQHSNNRITYFLTIPLEYDYKFDLYYLESIPSLMKDNYYTIIPNFKYLLINENFIKPLSDICNINGIYHCPSKILAHGNSTCEQSIIQRNSATGCLYTSISTKEDSLQPLPYLNQYLGWFKDSNSLEVVCPNEKQISKPTGIFLVKIPNTCKLIFKGEEFGQLEPSNSAPIIIDFKSQKFKSGIPISNMSIELRKLNLKEIQPIRLLPISHGISMPIYIPSIWTLLIYLLIVSSIGMFIKRRCQLKHQNETKSVEEQEVERNPRRLPADASF